MTDQNPNSSKYAADPTATKQDRAESPRAQTTDPSRKVHTPKSDAQSGESGNQQKHWLEYAIGIFAFIAAIGGLGAAIFAGWQAWTASDTEIRSLRSYAYLVLGSVTESEISNGTVVVSLNPTVKIFGQTPAASVIVPWNLSVQDWPMSDTFRFDYLFPSMKSTSVMAPGEERLIGEKSITLSLDDISKIDAGTKRLYMYGTILYGDVFRLPRYTNFCKIFDMGAIKTGKGVLECSIHNGADWNNSMEPVLKRLTVPMI